MDAYNELQVISSQCPTILKKQNIIIWDIFLPEYISQDIIWKLEYVQMAKKTMLSRGRFRET